MLISRCLERNARRHPDRLGLAFGQTRLSWVQLAARVNRVANALGDLGVGVGTPVSTVLPNGVELVEVQFACLAMGAIFVPLMPGSVEREITHVLGDVGAAVLVCEAAAVPSDRSAMAGLTVLTIDGAADGALSYADVTARAADSEIVAPITGDTIAAVRYTSGTTGAPKGCIATQGQLASVAAMFLAQIPMDGDDRATVSSPISAGLGVAMLHTFVCAGASIHLLPKFDAGELLATIARERITMAYAIETTFNRLNTHPDISATDLSSLRLLYGNSPGKDAADGFRRIRANPTFAGRFFNAYGSTEAGGSVTFNMPADIDAALADPALAPRTESIGREGMFCRIDCLDDHGHQVAAGEVGEMVIASPSIFHGYWNMPEAEAAVLRDGRLFTGDLAFKDADGFIFMAGRKRDMIKSGGLNVYPAEVERVLVSHPQVVEAAVIGVPDAQWGEKVVAFVVATGDCDAAVLTAHCAAQLAGFKRPKLYRFMSDLPKGETGKIVKRELRDIPLEPA